MLAPLDAEREAIRGLTEYQSPAELGGAIDRVAAAVDRVLRLMLRAEPAAADPARLGALSAELPAEEVVAALRRADTITMELAGGIAQLREAAARARGGAVTAADADIARDVLRRLATLIATAAAAGPVRPEHRAVAPSVPRVPGIGRPLLLAALLAFAGGYAWLALRPGSPDPQAGAEAFAAGRLEEAERIFRERTESGSGTVTDRLFLGRILRRTGRFEEAAAALRTAVDADPADADVRRELGWLFMDLGRPAPAVEQFRQALEIDPDDALNWNGLIRALRAAGDPSADEWLARSPGEVRSRLGSAAPERSPAR